MTIPTRSRPSNSKLAKIFDQALAKGHEIRYVDDQRLVVFEKNKLGCMGLIVLIILGLLTAFIVPVILLILGALSPSGRVLTYTVQPNGKIKRKISRP